MIGLGVIGAAVKGVAGYAAARGKERTTALAGGVCVAALYFRVTHPKAVDETMFYIVFGLGIVLALLKTEFMRALLVVIADTVKGKKNKKGKEDKKGKKGRKDKKGKKDK